MARSGDLYLGIFPRCVRIGSSLGREADAVGALGRVSVTSRTVPCPKPGIFQIQVDTRRARIL